MPATSASAPGKVILFGEHAVVYGQPAIAVPVKQVAAKAIVSPLITGAAGQIQIDAPDIAFASDLSELPTDNPLAAAVNGTLKALGISNPPAFKLRISSTIPVAAGLGSGAAVSVAIVRAVADFLGQVLPDERVSALAFDVEKLHHGTPSGIDNTVVVFSKAVYFIKGQDPETFEVAKPFTLLIADTGIASPTKIAVGDVRAAWQAEPKKHEALFAQIGLLVMQARAAIESGDLASMGRLMTENHALLQSLNVSCTELDDLVRAALEAGALGAKLSGGGRGGNMIALVSEENADVVAAALQTAGAKGLIKTIVQ
jgi:mevalonate kinase